MRGWIFGLSSLFLLNISIFGDSQDDLPVMIDRRNLTDRLNDNVYTIEFHGSDVVHHLSQNESSRMEFYAKLRDEILKYLNRKYINEMPKLTASDSLTTSPMYTSAQYSSVSSSAVQSSPSLSSAPPSSLSSEPFETTVTTDNAYESSSATSYDTTTTSPFVTTEIFSTPPTTSQPPETTTKTEDALTTATTTIQVPDTTMDELFLTTTTETIEEVLPPISKRKKRGVQSDDKAYQTENLKFIPLNKHIRNESFLVTLTLDPFHPDDLKEAIQHIQDTNALFNLTDLSVRTFYKGFPAEDIKDEKFKVPIVVIIILLILLVIIIACVIALICRNYRKRYQSHTLNHVMMNSSTQKLGLQPTIIDDGDGWIIPLDEYPDEQRYVHHNSRR